MKISQSTLFQIIKKLKKNELIELLQQAFIEMEDAPELRRYVFGDLYKEHTKDERSPENLLGEIEVFYESSMNGYYYAPFDINSKNFMDIPQETDEWFSEISDYLDFTCDLVENKAYISAVKCFNILFELIQVMADGHEIIFADEYGTWMITNEKDFIESYIIALSKTASAEKFCEGAIPLLRRDSYESFSEKVYEKVKKHSTKKQLLIVEKEIEKQSIETKSSYPY